MYSEPDGAAIKLFSQGQDDRGPKAYLVLNESAVIGGGGLMFKDEAYQFAQRVVAGKIPNLVGTTQCFVVLCQPAARFKDKAAFDNVQVDEVQPKASKNPSPTNDVAS